MLFNSNIFVFLFLPIALLGYYLLAHGRGAHAAKVWLCVASFVFYGWWNPAFLLLLFGSIAFNYTLSKSLTGEDSDQPDQRRQTRLISFGIAANLLLLIYYKYLFPLLGFLHHLGYTQLDFGSVILPIGISFFTFTQIGYLVDCRQGLVRERGLLNYVLFVTFFPHLIAGPILHHREIMPQFANDASYRFRAENLASGLTLFAFGMIKKVMLADMIAPCAEAGFAHVHALGTLQAWQVALAYSMQLYFDFSAYSDMAIGLGILFGIHLPHNFNSPYKASSIIDFWQRWHMTLTRYLTLLLYNPIALWVARRRQRAGMSTGRQAGATPLGFASMVMFPTLTTMFLAGVWHGAGLQFIMYGVLHGVYLSINHAWRIFVVRPPAKSAAPPVVLPLPMRVWSFLWPVVLTYLAVLVSQVFFRADTMADAWAVLAGMLGAHGTGLPLPIPANDVHYLGMFKGLLLDHGILAVGLREAYNTETLQFAMYALLILGLGLIAFAAPNVYQIMDEWSPALTKIRSHLKRSWLWRPTLPWALATGLMLFVASLRFDQAARFLYFQF